jgi:hypothetical protein
MSSEKPKSGLERQIEENLRKVYQKTVDEDVPDRFAELLKQLKEQDESK